MAKAKKKKSKIQKGKVTVPADKIIIFCTLVIVVSVAMLFVVTYDKNGKKEDEKPATQVTAPAQKEEKPETKSVEKSSEEKKTENVKAAEKTESAPKTKAEPSKELKESKEKEVKKAQEPKKTETVKTASTKTELAKKPESTSSQKKETPKAAVAPSPKKTESVPSPKKTETAKTQPAPKTQSAPKPAPKPVEASPKFNFPKAVNGAQLVFLFDDGGQNLSHLEKFLELPFPITVAVLPDLRDTTASAKRIIASGNELMLHQPMQAQNLKVNPGPGAITPDMSLSEAAEMVSKNLAQLPGVKGMNNHEGSLITADEFLMQSILSEARKKGVFFLDSRTTVDTKVPSVSMELGSGWYERNGFFLDNEKTREEFLKQLRKNLDIANKTGNVIMIAHIWSADYLPALLKEVYPELKAQGYIFKTVSTSNARKD